MFGWFKKEPVSQIERVSLPLLGWRNNMWVMTPDGIGIVFKLGADSEVHLIDSSGLTIASKIYETVSLRQAKYGEIPVVRRKMSKEQAAKLGYF